MENDTLCCENCGKTHFETPIIEKPLRMCYYSQLVIFEQNTSDNRTQENICIDCLKQLIELEKARWGMYDISLDSL